MQNKKKINVLSLFDGMSCGQLALKKAGINYDNYFASEIEKEAIKVAIDNFPNTICVGDVRGLKKESLPEIELLIGGSPCQSFSFAGKGVGMKTKCEVEITTLEKYLKLKNEGYEFQGQSYLFWEYVRLLKDLNPAYFLLENVLMNKKWENVISETLSVKPVIINSSLFSFQSRKRLYWTNIEFDKNIEDKNILFSNEYSKNYDNHLILKGIGLNKIYRDRSRVVSVKIDKLPTLLKAQEKKGTDSIVIKDSEVYRYPTREEAEKMQTVPIGYTKSAKYNNAMSMLGNGWTVDVIAHIFEGLK